MHKLAQPWASPSSIVSQIVNDYRDLPNWQTLKVMELAPLSDSRWVATIGDDKIVSYRARGTGTLTKPEPNTPAATNPDTQPTCMYRGDNTLIRCGGLADTGGNGVGVQYGPANPPGSPLPTDLGSLTNAQLADLGRRIAEENARRLAAPPAGTP